MRGRPWLNGVNFLKREKSINSNRVIIQGDGSSPVFLMVGDSRGREWVATM